MFVKSGMDKKKRTLSPVTRAIQAIGMSPKQFVEEKLGLKYPTYQYRVQQGVLRLEDYQRIMFYTGKQFSELWPSEWDLKSQRIPINLNGSPVTAQPQPQVITRSFHYSPPAATLPKSSVTVAPLPNPQVQEKKKEETFSSPPAPRIESIYDGGLPPIDD